MKAIWGQFAQKGAKAVIMWLTRFLPSIVSRLMNGPRPSNARQMYARLTGDSAGGLLAIRGLVNSTPLTFENEWRDFKGQPRNDKDVKEIWSEALGAFANTGGGVIVWGIDCRKQDGIDAACGFRLIDDPPAFLSRLKELLPEATEPPVQGIEMEYFCDPNEAQKGFVVCLIPESETKPHRSEFADRQWYIRVSDRCEVCPPPLLRSLFDAKGHCRFELHARITLRCHPVHRWPYLELVFSLLNTGTASAHDLVLRVGTRSFEPFLKDWEFSSENSGGLLEARKPLHPLQIVPAFSIQLRGVSEDTGGKIVRQSNEMLMVNVELYARDTDAQAAAFIFTDEQLCNQKHERTGFIRSKYTNPL
jgi:hypothetical protein